MAASPPDPNRMALRSTSLLELPLTGFRLSGTLIQQETVMLVCESRLEVGLNLKMWPLEWECNQASVIV